MFFVAGILVTQLLQFSDDLFHIGLKHLVAQNEFCVDIQGHNSIEVVVVKKMEHDGSTSNEGLDIGVVILQVVRKAFLNFGKQLALPPSPLEKRARSRWFSGHAF